MAVGDSRELMAGIVGSAMDAIIAVDDRQRIIVFNLAAETMFACPAADAIGSPLERFLPRHFPALHGADDRRFGEVAVSACSSGIEELRALRANGEEFPIEASTGRVVVGERTITTLIVRDLTERNRAEQALLESEQRFEVMADAAPAGHVGSCVDVTKLKGAEEVLSDFSRKLICAHELECSRLAGELHDDIGQRIALLKIELDRLDRDLPNRAADVRRRVRELSSIAAELGKDLHDISHRLHSPQLEYLGIVAASAGFCGELSREQEVAIEFSHQEIPEGLPHDVALGLFRVLQEAAINAAKHAGVRKFTVELRAKGAEIQLEVVDEGIGFDPETAMKGDGMGLIGMRERVGLLKGDLVIESRPGLGTRIRTLVPFDPAQTGRLDGATADLDEAPGDKSV